jgi:hypothetical protein
MFGQSIDEAAGAHFMLDSHHLALLDRFVASAQRHAKRNGRPFTGVVVEIDSSRPVSVHAADLAPLVLGLEPCMAGETAGSDRRRGHLRPVSCGPRSSTQG